MPRQEIESVFDKSAATYDQHRMKLAPLLDALYLLTAAVLAEMPVDARILCVGAGTGAEVIELAQRQPGWHFTAVEPSVPMIDVCRRKAEEAGVAGRCEFHSGYLDSLPETGAFDAATALLVSQFLLDRTARVAFFRGIAERLRPDGRLVTADLAADTNSAAYPSLLEVWWRVTRAADAPPEGLDRMGAAYDRSVAILPPAAVAALVAAGGFDAPVPFLQTGLIHAWFARRTAADALVRRRV